MFNQNYSFHTFEEGMLDQLRNLSSYGIIKISYNLKPANFCRYMTFGAEAGSEIKPVGFSLNNFTVVTKSMDMTGFIQGIYGPDYVFETFSVTQQRRSHASPFAGILSLQNPHACEIFNLVHYFIRGMFNFFI